MRKFFKDIDEWMYKVAMFFLGVAMVALMVIVTIQVVARYILKMSIGGMEELPVYLMLVSVWLGAIFVARKDKHFKISLADQVFKNKRVLAAFNAVVKLLTCVVITVFLFLSFTYVRGTLRMGDVTPGYGIPLWILQGVIPLSAAFMALYYGIQLFNETNAVIKWRS